MSAQVCDPFLLELLHAELETHASVLSQGLPCASANPAAIEPLVRAAHSLKGAARIVTLDVAARLAAAMEDLLVPAQQGKSTLAESDIATLIQAADLFASLAKIPATDIPASLEAQQSTIDDLIRALYPRPSGSPPAPLPPPPPPKPPVDLFMLDLFRSELETQSRVLEAGLVRAETERTASAIEPLMRAAHSIKGAARMVTLDRGVKLAHAMEDLLSAAQHGKHQLTPSDVDLLLQANDVFLKLSALDPAAIPEALEAQPEVQALTEALAVGQRFVAAAGFQPARTSPIPPPSPGNPAAKPDDGSVRVFVENLNRLTGLAGECLVEARSLKPLSAALYRIKQGHRLLAAAVARAAELTGEGALLEAQAKWEEAVQLAERIDSQIPAHIADFDRFARKLELLTNKLYDESVASRMRPFSDGLHGFSRMARDLARGMGKQVAFEIRGEATRVDRDILEKLEAPLNHLLRNAIDHGVELPHVREAAGKPPEARVTLEARHVSGVLEIVLSDDGAGIDLDRLRAKVLDRNYATPEVVADLSPAELLDFLFLPGFSTAAAVTEVSGRGVGLDIVQSMVREVGGNCRIETQLGRGARFILQLPLTLSVVRTLLVDIGGQLYAVPLTRIDGLLRVTPEELQVMENRQFCRHGGQTIGLVDAQQVLELPQAPRPSDTLSVLVLSDRLNRYGLVVDRFLGQRDLAVIPLHAQLGKVPNLSAGAILEDGTPVLILDADDLVRTLDNLLGHAALRKVGRRERSTRTGRKRILVVDDSLTVREVERRLLENRGYEVVLAVDGMDGWNTVQNGTFDLVVTDVDMPRMDGIELVRRLKSAKLTAALPVIIVSYKDQEEHRKKGLEAGAAYYLTKASFQDESLVNAARDLIGEPVAP